MQENQEIVGGAKRGLATKCKRNPWKNTTRIIPGKFPTRRERAFSSRVSCRTSHWSCSFELSIINYWLMSCTDVATIIDYNGVIARNISFLGDAV